MSYRRSQETKRRLEKLYQKTKTHYGVGVYYDYKKKRYIKYSCGKRLMRKYLRKMSSKNMRRYQEPLNYGLYRRTFDYWWNLL